MKLDELLGVKKFYDFDLEQVLKSMKNYKEEGRGTFSVVMGSGNEVIKFWISDSAYDAFINYVIANPSKYFPKLLSKPKNLSAFFRRPENFPDKIKYVRMEKLSYKRSDVEAGIIQMIFDDLKFCRNQKELDFLISNTQKPTDKYPSKSKEILKSMIKDIPEFYREMYKMIKDLVREKGNRLDIHDFNMGYRPNGELVIIDPIYNTKSLDDLDHIFIALRDVEQNTISGRTPRK